MNKATMFAVSMLMIATLVGLGASAEAPDDTGEDLGTATKGRFLSVEPCPTRCEPMFEDELLYVDSNGGVITICSDECPWPPNGNGKRTANLQ